MIANAILCARLVVEETGRMWCTMSDRKINSMGTAEIAANFRPIICCREKSPHTSRLEVILPRAELVSKRNANFLNIGRTIGGCILGLLKLQKEKIKLQKNYELRAMMLLRSIARF